MLIHSSSVPKIWLQLFALTCSDVVLMSKSTSNPDISAIILYKENMYITISGLTQDYWFIDHYNNCESLITIITFLFLWTVSYTMKWMSYKVITYSLTFFAFSNCLDCFTEWMKKWCWYHYKIVSRTQYNYSKFACNVIICQHMI